ncbi:histidinol-phosphatase [Allosaccharopolyspora coralli]|uniref:Histidinol-phosphatase n=1 Tax=Allosaccharopolyspora coralli TaxID=2665642 RepID=A0A5Q3Q5X4_9PSEU|nr:inositol monophosphatase family protein [Allosaccharopolyspora coralli]QGK69998.1 histidinol-phosphatase [Allosaccharopolyspora coralli]
MNVDSSDMKLVALLADAADTITTSRVGTENLRVERKPDRTPVSDADIAVEDEIRTILARERPDDTVVGEEGGGAVTTGRTWMIDPIDGTKAFLRGLPVWATLVALLDRGQPVAGAVSAPMLGRRWWAGRGHGAYVRGQDNRDSQMTVSAVSQLDDAIVSSSHLGTWPEFHNRESYLALVDACWEDRAYGDFWSHCLVAEGALDLAADPIVNAWDVAPLKIIVEEAGGRFTDLSGSNTIDGGNALSSNALLHESALRLLAR